MQNWLEFTLIDMNYDLNVSLSCYNNFNLFFLNKRLIKLFFLIKIFLFRLIISVMNQSEIFLDLIFFYDYKYFSISGLFIYERGNDSTAVVWYLSYIDDSHTLDPLEMSFFLVWVSCH